MDGLAPSPARMRARNKIRRIAMKKILCLLLAALMLLSLAACGPTEDGGDTTTKPNTQSVKRYK